ncbi:hypothetical protein [Roseateles amylovorans]|uniref:Uncharacterized protein n=1 Tax=Roseateles amylovorans TaxID=2978473 RepID=A0ABY6B852_9BURK|nr:hypothetical protein [Roseateles amylovorans]UXH80640.1 hypothetical protein N4261_12495 [Roseateles amylovorans]
MMIDEVRWTEFLKGYVVKDCTIGFEEGRLGFLLYEELEEGASLENGFKIRILSVKLSNDMDKRFFSMSANGLGVGARLASAWAPQNEEFVAVGIGRETYSYKPKAYKGREETIPFEGRKLSADAYHEFDAAITKTVRVGCTVFAVGVPFRIFERMDAQRWKEHDDIAIPPEIGSSDRETMMDAVTNSTFQDLAGTSPQDMYAVGGEGTVWRRQGEAWKRMKFPGDLSLHTVAVEPNGTTYI